MSKPGGAVAFAETTFEQRDCRHDHSLPSPRSHRQLAFAGFRPKALHRVLRFQGFLALVQHAIAQGRAPTNDGRLVRVKRAYDPHDLFRFAQSL